MLGAKLLMSTAFHPQTDRASEHAIRTTAQMLHAMVRPDQRNWVEKVPMVEYALNSSISSSTGFAPFKLNYGHMPIMMSHMEKGVCYDRFSLLVGTENRDSSEVGEMLTTAHREFSGCAHRCMGKLKRREQDRASPRRRERAQLGTAEG